MKNDFELSEKDGQILVKTARKVVNEYLKNRSKIELEKENFKKNFHLNLEFLLL